MKFKTLKIINYLLLIIPNVYAQQTAHEIYTIAFYNLENLFHPSDDPNTKDDDRTPQGKDHWTMEDYKSKQNQMAKVIADIGSNITKNAPTILGVAEIENYTVLEDLIKTKNLQKFNYGIIHYDSPDRRGIDVAMLYQKELFTPISSKAHPLNLKDIKTNKKIYTRDQLLVTGYLQGELFHFIINHWPSRRGGVKKSTYKRNTAAQLTRNIIDSLQKNTPEAKIICMGDFNDSPKNKSIKKIIGTINHRKSKFNTLGKKLYNPMYQMERKGQGTLAWNDKWHIYDQIMYSQNLLKINKPKSITYYKTKIFTADYLKHQKGRYKGYPFRSFSKGQFTNGYSDHFPVYGFLVRQL